MVVKQQLFAEIIKRKVSNNNFKNNNFKYAYLKFYISLNSSNVKNKSYISYINLDPLDNTENSKYILNEYNWFYYCSKDINGLLDVNNNSSIAKILKQRLYCNNISFSRDNKTLLKYFLKDFEYINKKSCKKICNTCKTTDTIECKNCIFYYNLDETSYIKTYS